MGTNCAPLLADLLSNLYLIEIEIKDTTYIAMSASYINIHLGIDIEGQLKTKLYGKKRLFQFSHCELSIYVY